MKKVSLTLTLLLICCVQTSRADVISEVEVPNIHYSQQHSLALIGVSLASVITLFFVLRLRNRQLPLKNLLQMPVFYLNTILLAISLVSLLFIKKTITKEEYTGSAKREIVPPDTISVKPDSTQKP
jgi:hypothetical protein